MGVMGMTMYRLTRRLAGRKPALQPLHRATDGTSVCFGGGRWRQRSVALCQQPTPLDHNETELHHGLAAVDVPRASPENVSWLRPDLLPVAACGPQARCAPPARRECGQDARDRPVSL